MWLYTVKRCAPYFSVASKKGDLRRRAPRWMSFMSNVAVI
jgi:hypothetical protein